MVKRISKKLKARKAHKAEKKLYKTLKKEAKILANKEETAFDKVVISWTAPEYIKQRLENDTTLKIGVINQSTETLPLQKSK